MKIKENINVVAKMNKKMLDKMDQNISDNRVDNKFSKTEIRKSVSDFYTDIATNKTKIKVDNSQLAKAIGYDDKDLKDIPEEANLGLGCGNPQEDAKPKEGEILIDLGCGKGMDVFLASKKVGTNGRVIGVDMLPDMLRDARKIAKKNSYTNVEFRLGEIENLPVANEYVDLVLSNCVINLSVDKQRVYDEIYRVLKHGGRIGISDIVLKKHLPQEILDDPNMYGT